MHEVKKILEDMSYEELVQLQHEVATGRFQSIVRQRIQKIRPRICPVCSTEVSTEHFILIFGPDELRQKASFDGVDCLNYFVENHLKNTD